MSVASVARSVRALVRGLTLAGLLGCGSIAFAAADDAVIYPAGATRRETPPAGGAPTGNAGLLAAALVLAGIGGWMYWRHARNRPLMREGRALQIVETRPLGNRQYLVVANYGSSTFLLGVCPGSINLLTSLADPAAESRPASRS